MSNIKLLPYSEDQMNKYWNFIDHSAELGDPKFYEIWVDNEEVISRTDNPSEFERYRYYITSRTRTVKVVIYRDRDGDAKEEFGMFIKEPERQSGGLSGLEVEQRIQDALKVERKQWEHTSLQEKYDALEDKLEEAEEYIDDLEKQISMMKENKHKIGDIHMGELASVMVESFLKRNAGNLPGGDMISGLLGHTTAPAGAPASGQPDTGASFSKAAPDTPALSEEDTICLKNGKALKKSFTSEELKDVFTILGTLGKKKSLIADVLELIKGEVK